MIINKNARFWKDKRNNYRLDTPSSTPRDEQDSQLSRVIFCIVSILLAIGIVSLVYNAINMYQTEQCRSRKIRENYTTGNRPTDISPDLEKKSPNKYVRSNHYRRRDCAVWSPQRVDRQGETNCQML